MKSFLAIIPARGGSKRLPRKNILPLVGTPLIAWTIEAAKASKYCSTVCVSTDDKEITDISLKFGAEVPFVRPLTLSSDTATSVDVVLHALDYYESIGRKFDFVVLLQPTSPLRTVDDIDNSIKVLLANNALSVTSVCETEHSPLWSNTLPANLSMNEFVSKKYKNIRSQDLPKYYRLNGAIYITSVEYIEKEKCLISDVHSFAFIMSQDHSVDIDTELDFLIAEKLVDKK